MRARMKIAHRSARFGSHLLEAGQVIATAGFEGFEVSPAEMLHHLKNGHADAIKTPALEVTAPPPMETAESPPNGTGVRPAAKKPARRQRGRPRKS